MNSFQLGWLFLHQDGYALTNETSGSQSFVKAEPLIPMSGDCSFAYASDIAGNRGRKAGRIVELPF
jgi:hypothetical protein